MSPFLGVAGLGGAGSLLAEKTIPETKWWLTYGGTGSEFAQGFHRDSNGNLYTMSHTGSFGAGVYTHLMVKFDSEGVKQWDTCLGTNGQDYTDDYKKCITSDSLGNVYATGETNGYGFTRNLLYKLNSSGTLQWVQAMYQQSGTASYSGGVECDNAGNIYVFGDGAGNGYIIKLNSSGVVQWQRNTGSNSNWTTATFDSSDNIYLTGQWNNDCIVTKLNSSGVEQWSQRLYYTSRWHLGRGIGLDSSGNVYVCGNYRPTSGGNPNGMFIVKYNSSGTYQWSRKISSASNEDWADGLAVAADKIYIGGSAGATGSYTPGFMAQYDTSGNIQWQRTFTRNGSTSGYMNGTGIAASSSGYVFPHYYQSWQGPGGYDGFIGKFPADGSDTGTYGNFVYASSSVPESSYFVLYANYVLSGSLGSWGSVVNAGVTNYTSSVTSTVTYY